MRPAESFALDRSARDAHVRTLQSRRKRYDAYRDKNHREQMYMSARRRHASCILSDQVLEASSSFAAWATSNCGLVRRSKLEHESLDGPLRATSRIRLGGTGRPSASAIAVALTLAALGLALALYLVLMR